MMVAGSNGRGSRARAGMAALAVGLALAVSPVALAAPSHGPSALPLVPWPAQVVPGKGALVLANGATLAVPPGDTAAKAAATLLAARLSAQHGLSLRVVEGDKGTVRFVRGGKAGDEAYALAVSASGAVITASGDHGLLYGAMSLEQLAGVPGKGGAAVRVPALAVTDAPRFAWRGLMIDTARHFQPIASIRAVIDGMVAVKLNVLHLHLTDDQGWRFEVKKYPRLTQVGAWRTQPDTGQGPDADKGARSGGFYTQAELRDLVAYAAARGITVVPEIDLPGHAQALVAAYPELGVLGGTPPVSGDWGVNPYLFNPGPQGMAFVKDVLDELMAVFPSTFIHLGGDEAVKDQWERAPQVQAQMRALGIKTENGLQSWMIDQLGSYLAQHGRRLIGWDEILEGGLPPSASVMSWRGEAGAVDAANAGHDVVLSPAPNLYLDNLQSDRGDAPPGRIAIQTLEAVYHYDPMPKGIDAQKAAHVLGAQANAWSEYIVTPWQMQHKIFPRIGALAESVWSNPAQAKDYPGFLARLDPQMRRWREAGLEVADSALAVDFKIAGTRSAALDAKRLTVALATQAPYGTIRYTLDGKAPTARARAYAAPLAVAPGTVIMAADFAADGAALSAPRRFDATRDTLLTTANSALSACPRGALGLRVPLNADATANGPAFNVNIFDACVADDHAPLAHAKAITVKVARLPRNYGLAHDQHAVIARYATSPFGELVVSAGCRAAEKAANDQQKEHDPMPGARVLATWPLPDPAKAPQQFALDANLPQLGLADESDVCFQFTASPAGPFYTVEQVQWHETPRGGAK
ncbi:beta-N-acetylhexosaminidase [Novosphingobium capsulatum]|uniref:beta-N-acetylhexosaminidase n=1 Tax=Novosphingobium capsulatum TaxID=13688 RepID=UPI000AF76AFB|nr:family 20 glycosylhydrolase [Novosphingobium capsulatum]WQD94090.1 family 20 glycosylhydrolase [Novosphingobium capsulatum]